MSSHDSLAVSGNSPTRSDGRDFRSENHGSLFLLLPLTPSAHSWIEEHLPEDAQWFGSNGRSRRASVYLDYPRWYSGRRIGGEPWIKNSLRKRFALV